jgi:hypothetical protein
MTLKQFSTRSKQTPNRTGMPARAVLAITFSLAANGISAAPPLFHEKKAIRALEDFVAEYKLYATCLSLAPDGLSSVKQMRKFQFEKAAENLPRTASLYFLTRFSLARSSDLVNENMKLGDAIKLCEANKEVASKFYSFASTDLATVLHNAK